MTAKSTVNLDAMIPRSDFALTLGESGSGEKMKSLGVEQLSSGSMVIRNMRKPDFQRETNHWTPQQLVTFLKSYVDQELIPSVILWQSPSFIFVIDGAHRLSALRAWIEDDYGDGAVSQKFYGYEIPDAQKRIAKRVRNLIDKEIGNYSVLREAVGETDGFSEVVRTRASVMASRSFALQWVEGDAEKAESSFFKINTQGTPLHKTEERLLRNRRKPIAITARSIYRAGTGNKYWSHFDDSVREDIEGLSRELNDFLFRPEVKQPIKTLDLPLGGTSSPIDSLNLLMDFIQITAGKLGDGSDNTAIDETDEDGQASIETLEICLKVMNRITGNQAGSLGLHPAVYFYNNRGKHSQHLFQAIISVFARRVRNNDKAFFKKFTKARGKMEAFLVANKPLLAQAIVQIGSTSRIPRLIEMYEQLIDRFAKGEEVEALELLKILKLQGKLLAKDVEAIGTGFDPSTKSEILLRTSLVSAVKCPICDGLVDVGKSVSYDHVERVEDGGKGEADNGQITHPYCNTAIKH